MKLNSDDLVNLKVIIKQYLKQNEDSWCKNYCYELLERLDKAYKKWEEKSEKEFNEAIGAVNKVYENRKKGIYNKKDEEKLRKIIRRKSK